MTKSATLIFNLGQHSTSAILASFCFERSKQKATPLAGMDNVEVDEIYNGYMLGQRLQELGHRAVLILAHDHLTDQAVRVRGRAKQVIAPLRMMGKNERVADLDFCGLQVSFSKMSSGVGREEMLRCYCAGSRRQPILATPILANTKETKANMPCPDLDGTGKLETNFL